jgi:DNA-binding protein HU-beta
VNRARKRSLSIPYQSLVPVLGGGARERQPVVLQQNRGISLLFAFDGGNLGPLDSDFDFDSPEGAPRMNKNELIQQLSDRASLGKNEAAKAVDSIFEIIAEALKAGDEVRLTGFGVFAVAARAGGKGRNPQTGEEITIKPSKQPRFRAGKQLKDSLNG